MVNTYAAKPMFAASTMRATPKPVRDLAPAPCSLSRLTEGVRGEWRTKLCSGVAGACVFALGLGAVQGVRSLRATLAASAAFAAKPTMIHVTVAPGDTLWSLSERYGSDKVNIQERIDALARANDMHTGTGLVAGERLLVPVTNPTVLAHLQAHIASR